MGNRGDDDMRTFGRADPEGEPALERKREHLRERYSGLIEDLAANHRIMKGQVSIYSRAIMAINELINRC